MPLLLDTAQPGSAIAIHAANCVTVGLINNMPDPALATTERQLIDLFRASTSNTIVRLLLFSIPEVPRGNEVRQELAGRYRNVSELWDTQLDGLVVTGNEPRSENLKDEPYWRPLAQIIEWARGHTTSTIWSCLAAHAAVLHCDGIERQPLPEKCFGIFDCEPVAAHPITQDAALPMRVPHSRWNNLPEQALTSCGYRIVTRSAAAGVDMFARHDKSFHLFLQGHPEYDAGTLLREYRRDIGRYLRGEREHYPAMPQGYFDDEAAAMVEAFREHALADRRGELIASFPMRWLEAGLANAWRGSAVRIYENWFDYLKGCKADRRPPTVPMRRAWRDWPARNVRLAAGVSATRR
jgi:homoserine O-succinyltransferase/O-acetyltransferase